MNLETGLEALNDDVHRKVAQIFAQLAGADLRQIDPSVPARCDHITRALINEHDPGLADNIAFHLTDWTSNAAFLVAVQLFPERFTPEEIEQGITALLIHAPNHLAAAAKLAGRPVQDVFRVGPLEKPQP